MSTTTVGGRSFWYGLLAPPAAWAVQEWLGWFFGERTCGALTPPTVRWIVLGISVAALLVALVGIARSWRAWRQRSDAPTILATDAGERIEFMALGGLFVSVVFAVGITWAGLSSAFLSDCGRIR